MKVNMNRYPILLSSILLAALLTGCNLDTPEPPREVSYSMPPALSDCKVHAIDAVSHPKLYVVRCAGTGKKTETSVEWSQSSGKTTTYYHTVLIDGTEYIKKDEKTAPIVVNGVEYIKAAK